MRRKLEYIDALRGWAILAVIAVHTSTWVPADAIWIHAIASKGAVGVQLFYLVSAFTLLLSYHSRKDEPHAMRNYCIRRFFRVAPMFYVAILVYGPLRDSLTPRYWMPDGIEPWHYLTSLTFTHGWHPLSVNALVPGGWSMGVEMTFYIVFPVFVLLVTSIRRAVIFTVVSLILGMVISQWADWWFSPILSERDYRHIVNFAYTYIPTAQICVFGLGFVLYYLNSARNRMSYPPITGVILIALGLASCLLLAFIQVPVIPVFFQFSLAFIPLALGLSILPIKIIVNRLTCFIGKLSYSIYLIHFGVIYLLKLLLPEFNFTDGQTINFLLCLLIVTILTVGLSYISYFLIEKPGTGVGHAIIDKLRVT